MSRLVYRKGTDLLAAAIPVICAKNSEVEFLIGEKKNGRFFFKSQKFPKF